MNVDKKEIPEKASLSPLTDCLQDYMKSGYTGVDIDLVLNELSLIEAKSQQFPLRPNIVCLCGSSRFWKEYQEAEYRETMAGNIYLSIGFYPHSDVHGEGVGHDSAEKIALDELHKRKIELADEIFVVNVGGYVGESTKSEICHALKKEKPIRWLEPEKAWQPLFHPTQG